MTMAAGFRPLLIVKIKPGVGQIDFAILRSGLISPYILKFATFDYRILT